MSLNKENISRVQRQLAHMIKVDPSARAKRLYNLVYHPDWLATALERVLRNTGSQTPGVDGVTLRQLKDEAFKRAFLVEIADALKHRTYAPQPCRRVYIPKPHKPTQQRPLGIPVIADRTVQMVVTMLLEPLYEGVFRPFSYGFRPGRSTHQALGRTMHFLNHASGHWHWILEGDIEACFERVHHAILLKLLKKRVQDERFLGLIHAFLKAGVIEDGRFQRTDHGTPQGGVCSPLLMNVYLHEFDAWLETRYIAPPHLAEKSEATHNRWRRDSVGGRIIPVRYADDWLVLWNGTQAQLEQIRAEIAAFLHEHLALTLSAEKTRITHLDQGFTFLGYTLRRERNRSTRKQNVFALPSQANLHKYRAKVKQIASHLAVPDLTEVFRQYNRVTRGWAMHFRFGNSKAVFARLAYHNWWTFYRALRKRHGKRSKAWVLQHYTHRVPSTTGTRTTFGMRVGDELVTMYHLAGVQVERLPHLHHHTPNPYLTAWETTLETSPQLYPAWNGEETRPGQSQFARTVRQRDKVCQRCGEARAEVAHHLQRWSRRPTMDPASGVGLCKRCHIAMHREEQRRAGYSETGKPSSEGGAEKRAS
jgi:RNA-directed DNA polymerase